MTKTLEFTGSLNPGDRLIINSDKMTALLNGEDVRHLIEGDYLMIQPGPQELEYSDSDDEISRKLRIKLRWKARWL